MTVYPSGLMNITLWPKISNNFCQIPRAHWNLLDFSATLNPIQSSLSWVPAPLASFAPSPAGCSCPLWFCLSWVPLFLSLPLDHGCSLGSLLAHCSSEWAHPLWGISPLFMVWDAHDTLFLLPAMCVPCHLTQPLISWISITVCTWAPPPQHDPGSLTCCYLYSLCQGHHQPQPQPFSHLL